MAISEIGGATNNLKPKTMYQLIQFFIILAVTAVLITVFAIKASKKQTN